MSVYNLKLGKDMKEINDLFRVPLGMSELTGVNNPQWVATAVTAGLGAIGSLFGGNKAKKLAKKALRENAYRTNAEKAWYEKEYNTDYMDTKMGQNMLRRAQEIQDNYIRKADGAAAVGGGTAASSAMAKEAANRTMGNTIANIGAQDTARKQQVSDQHMQNQQNLSQQRENIYNQQAQNVTEATQNFSNSMFNAAASSLANDLNEPKKTMNIDVKSADAKAAKQGSIVPKVNVNEVLYGAYDNPLKKVTGV